MRKSRDLCMFKNVKDHSEIFCKILLANSHIYTIAIHHNHLKVQQNVAAGCQSIYHQCFPFSVDVFNVRWRAMIVEISHHKNEIFDLMWLWHQIYSIPCFQFPVCADIWFLWLVLSGKIYHAFSGPISLVSAINALSAIKQDNRLSNRDRQHDPPVCDVTE